MRDNLPMIRPSEHRRSVATVALIVAVLGLAAGFISGHAVGMDQGARVTRSEADAEAVRVDASLATCSAAVEGLLVRAGEAARTVDAARCEAKALRELYARCLAGECLSRLPDNLCLQ